MRGYILPLLSAVPFLNHPHPLHRFPRCPDSMWHIMAPSQPQPPQLHPMDKQAQLAGAGACPDLAAELGHSQDTYLGGAESQSKRLLGSKVLLNNTWHVVTLTTFQNAPQPCYTIKVPCCSWVCHSSNYKYVTVKAMEKRSQLLCTVRYIIRKMNMPVSFIYESTLPFVQKLLKTKIIYSPNDNKWKKGRERIKLLFFFSSKHVFSIKIWQNVSLSLALGKKISSLFTVASSPVILFLFT